MRRSDVTEGVTLKRAGLATLMAGMLLLTGWVLFPGQAQAVFPGVPGNCDSSGTTINPGGSATVNGVEIDLSGTSITIIGGSATVCVKAGACNSGNISLGPGTHSLSGIIEWNAGNDCADPSPPHPGVSHIVVYSTQTTTPPTTTETTPPTTTETTPPTTTETTPPTTSVQPTTITPTDDTTPPETSVQPTTVTPGGTAFTGPEDVVPLGLIALAMLTAGTGLLWAGSRRSRNVED